MASISKRVSGSWVSDSYGIMETATDTLTTLPAVLYPTGSTATVGLKGQAVQSSTPSPTSPVMPEGCGDLETSGAKVGQFKIPVLNGATTTPVYLGEVQTERQIQKHEFTGNETLVFYNSGSSGIGFRTTFSDMKSNSRTDGYCSHFTPIYAPSGSTSDSVTFGVVNSVIYFIFSAATATALNLTDLPSIKTYLQQQYANGTPVTVWYVLSSATVGIVNEPLMKIGNYADEVSNISIPVTAGGDTISVGTTVQPSEVTANYKGWHPVADVHERDNGAWT